jgi:hypothetical protein
MKHGVLTERVGSCLQNSLGGFDSHTRLQQDYYSVMKMSTDSWIARCIIKYRMPFAVITAILYAIAILLVAFVFPDISNLWVSIFVLFSGFTASIATLGDLLVSTEDK